MKYLSIAVFTLLLFSCSKITDVKEPLQVDQDVLFSTPKGFTDALSAVYLDMVDANLYGKELSIGMLSIAGRSYDNFDISDLSGVSQLYINTAQYNFNTTEVITKANTIWTNMYYCIEKVNIVLSKLEEKRGIFTEAQYNQVKGEALGLRAFLHFDLLRLFVASPKKLNYDFTKPAIPYVTKFNSQGITTPTVGDFFNLCISDIKNSQESFAKGNNNTPSITQRSQFNNPAATALMARVCLYKGDLENAAKAATDVIDSKKVTLAKASPENGMLDDNIFYLYLSSGFFGYCGDVYNSGKFGFSLLSQPKLFKTAGDWRNVYVGPDGKSGSTPLIRPKKFEGENWVPQATDEMPMIRLSEMYYIAAECALMSSTPVPETAAKFLDTVRIHRGLPLFTKPIPSTDSLISEVKYEHLREFMAEGQAFYYFKRVDANIATLPFMKLPVLSNASYVFSHSN